MIFRREGEKFEILDPQHVEVIEGTWFRRIISGETPWATVVAGRQVVFQDDFGHRLVYDTVAYDGDLGVWRLRRVT